MQVIVFLKTSNVAVSYTHLGLPRRLKSQTAAELAETHHVTLEDVQIYSYGEAYSKLEGKTLSPFTNDDYLVGFRSAVIDYGYDILDVYKRQLTGRADHAARISG